MPQVVNSAGKAFGDNAAGCFGAVVFMTVNDFIICKPPAFKLFVVSQRVEIAFEIVFQIFDNGGQGIVTEVERAPFFALFIKRFYSRKYFFRVGRPEIVAGVFRKRVFRKVFREQAPFPEDV